MGKAGPSLGLAAALLLLGDAAATSFLDGPPTAEAAQQRSSCIPRGSKDPTYDWSRLQIMPRDDGTERPTRKSFESQKKNQTSQIVLDPVRNVQVAFISGVTLEAAPGSRKWTVVQTQTCPPARWAGAMAYDPINHEIVMWGGTMSMAGPTNDTWIYDTSDRDWRKLESGAAEIRDLRSKVEDLRDDLEALRWDLWKTLEWKVTGKRGAQSEPALAARRDELEAELAAVEVLAGEAQSAVVGYDQTQAEGARQWLGSARAKLAKLGSGLKARTLDGLEADYRALVSLRPDMLRAVDAVRLAPPSRFFVALDHDPSRDVFVLKSTVGRDYPDRWIYLLRERRWQRESPPPGDGALPAVPEGEFVLRDAATVAELQQWQAETSAWAASLPANTWVVAPAHGTGRPNWGRSWSSIVYDPDREQLYYRDGGHGSYHGNVTDHYDIRTGRWFRSDVVQVPDKGIMGGYFGWGRGYNYAPWALHTYKWNLFYNPLTGHLQRLGFYTPDRVQGNVNDYDPDQGKWSEHPATVNLVGTVVPGVTDAIVSVHGWERYSGIPSATVGRQTASGFETWSNTGPIAFHGANYDDDYAFVFDPRRNRILYYGGEGGSLGLFALDLEASRPRWRQLDVSAEGAVAIPRAYREWIYIPKHDVFLTMAWRRGAKGAPEVWSFDPEENLFRRTTLALGPGVVAGDGANRLGPATVSSGLTYDPVSDVAFYIRAASAPPSLFAFRYVPAEP